MTFPWSSTQRKLEVAPAPLCEEAGKFCARVAHAHSSETAQPVSTPAASSFDRAAPISSGSRPEAERPTDSVNFSLDCLILSPANSAMG